MIDVLIATNERDTLIESIVPYITSAIKILCKNPSGHAEEIIMLTREAIGLYTQCPSFVDAFSMFMSLSDEQKNQTIEFMRSITRR